MKITSVTIKNFRAYREEVTIEIDDLTVLIGKNDAGKSTVLEMLDIFFNDEKMDKADVNMACRANGDLETIFAVRFCDLPTQVDIDAGNLTRLQDEYLTIGDNEFEVVKKYKDAGKPKTFIRAKHPSNPACCDLLKKKQAELRKMVANLGLSCDKNVNSEMRRALWKHYGSDLQIRECELDVDTKDGDVKAIWEKVQNYLPAYFLFESDRSNSEKDEEVQDPLKAALKNILKDSAIVGKLDEIGQIVGERIQDVTTRTLDKLKEMNTGIADTLHPNLPVPKWEDVFKGISITGDNDIPLDKRGSGVRRLILLNFFRAEADRKQHEQDAPAIIYAIEEPETSLHADFQRTLMQAFKRLSTIETVQVLLTTHSSHIVKESAFENLRLVTLNSGEASVQAVDERGVLPYVSLNEVSYLAFGGEVSIEYHDELYGFLQARACEDDPKYEKEKHFDPWLANNGVPQTMSWIRIQNGIPWDPMPVTLPTYVRNSIHHPENKQNAPASTSQIKQSIALMRRIADQLPEREKES